MSGTSPSSIATRSLPEGFLLDTLAREVREATAELGSFEERLDVHDFEVRTFPEHRQQILEPDRAVGRMEARRVLQPSLARHPPDHQVVAAEGLRAFKRTTILGYEIPWNNFNFDYQAYFALEKEHVERKVRALAKNRSSTAGTGPRIHLERRPDARDQRESRVCGGVRGLPSRGVSGTPGEPRRSRPAFEPGYGISQDEEGMLEWNWAEERLASSRNYWIVTTGGDG